MDYHLFCFDYDETLASEGVVNPLSVKALQRLRAAGFKLVLVTGRIVSNLLDIFPEISICDLVVAENGGTIYHPLKDEETILAPPAPENLVMSLKKEIVPVTVGQTIVASQVGFETTILRVIRELGIEYQIIFNKGSIMMLPSGINKASGLTAALAQLKVPAKATVGIGDGENDHAFLELCGYSVAVSNAVESLKDQVDWVAAGPNGSGVRELVDRLLSPQGLD